MIWLIIILGIFLRLLSVNQSFWLDEATSGLAVQMNYHEFIYFLRGDFHPPLYYLLLRIWSFLFGTSEFGLRSLSVLFGVLSIWLVFKISGLIFNKKAALISALFLATSGLHVDFSQEARMYVLASFLILLANYYFVKIIKWDRVGDWFVFSLILGLVGATHYLALLIIPVYWVYGLILRKKFFWYIKLLMSHIILFISGLFWLPIFVQQLFSGLNVQKTYPVWWNILGHSNFKTILLIPVKFMIGRISWDNKIQYGLIVLIFILIYGYLIFRAIRKSIGSKKYFLFIFLWMIIPTFLSFILGYYLSVFEYFRLLFVLPALCIIVAVGITSFNNFKSNAFTVFLVTANLVFISIYLFNPRFHREDWKSAALFLMNQPDIKGQIVIFPSGYQTEALRYYLYPGVMGGVKLINNNYHTVWLMRYAQPIFDPLDKIKDTIEADGYRKIEEVNFEKVLIFKYQK